MAKKGENIYKRSDGRWEGRYIKGRRQNGKPKYGYVYGYKYKDVKAKLMPLKCFYADRQGLYDGFWGTLADWVCYYMEETVSSKIKPSTYAYYHGLLQNHILPTLGNRKLVAINQADVQGLVELLKGKGLGANSVRGIIQMLSRVMAAAAKKNLLLSNPCTGLNLPEKERPRIEPLNRSDQQQLETAAMDDRDGIAVMLALYTGARIGEICALRWDDIDFTRGLLYVRRTIQRISNKSGNGNKTILTFGTPKSIYSNRVVPLTTKLLHLLEQEKIKSKSAYVVGCRGSFAEPRIVRYRFERIARNANMDASIHFHGLRHTFATRCIETGMDITALSRILGHSSIKMTLDIYTSATLEHKVASIQRLDDLDDKPLAVAI